MQEETKTSLTLDNGVSIEIRTTAEREFVGIGTVTVAGVPLRNGDVPLRPWLRSIHGMDYPRFILETVEPEGDGVAVRLTACGVFRHEEAYGDQYNDHIFRVRQQAGSVADRLTLHLRPETLSLHGVDYAGFSHAWEFSSATEQIHRLITVATWEIGGSATGNTILSQGQVTPAVHTAQRETHFTSACLINLRDFGKPQNMSFQWSPRWSPHQCFDFLASEKGTLLGYWPEKADIRSFIVKNPGEDVCFICDAEHVTATDRFTTARKAILFAPAGTEGMPDHTMRNRWKDAYDFCCARARSFFGITKTRPLPERLIPYDTRMEKDRRVSFKVGETWVPSQEWLVAIADTFLPGLAAQGVRRVMTDPVSESDPTENGFICKLDGGIHGDINFGSVCCTHRYRPAAFFGGMKAWRYYFDKAHALGLEVGHWVGMHLAHSAPILREHPEWAHTGFNTLDFSGGYPNYVVRAINFNTPVRQWIINDLKAWKDEGGLDYIWIDSFANLGALAVDFGKDIQPGQLACAEFIAEIQKTVGIRDIAVEGMSPLAMSGAHIMDVDPAITGGVQFIAGQNCWAWYQGGEDMLCDQQPRAGIHPARTEQDARERFFRCLANRVMTEMKPYAKAIGTGPAWYREYLDTYFAVEQHLTEGRRELLPDRRGVIWQNGDTRILFAYRDGTFDTGSAASVERIAGGTALPVPAGTSLPLEAWTVYRIRG